MKSVMDKLCRNVSLEEIENSIKFSCKHPYWKIKERKITSPERQRLLAILEKLVDLLGKTLP